MTEKIDTLLKWIECVAVSANGLFIPVSGGSDSALCFWLCAKVFPKKTVAVHAGSNLRGAEWFANVGAVEGVETPGAYEEREEMRWARFLSMSLARHAWLVGSRNRTEQLLGTYSLSSRVSTFLPLVGTWKSDVLAMARHVGVPEDILASSLRADPDCGRPKELAEIPFASVEDFLKVRCGEVAEDASRTLSDAQIRYLDAICIRNAFKSTLPIRGPLVF